VTDADLIRFVDAQSDVYNQVVQELSEGRKRSHWMWFIFPQVAVWSPLLIAGSEGPALVSSAAPHLLRCQGVRGARSGPVWPATDASQPYIF
jgi:uncharacterized protein DUF1810